MGNGWKGPADPPSRGRELESAVKPGPGPLPVSPLHHVDIFARSGNLQGRFRGWAKIWRKRGDHGMGPWPHGIPEQSIRDSGRPESTLTLSRLSQTAGG